MAKTPTIKVDLTWDKKIFRALRDRIIEIFSPLIEERSIKEVESWDAGVWTGESAEDYCDACLIDVNAAAGKDEKVKSHCKLPVREPGDASDVYVDKAVMAAAGGRGITRLEKPADVPQEDWDKAVKAAANKIISAYKEMDKVAPDSVYEAAGKEPPERERALSGEAMFSQLLNGLFEKGEWFWLNDIYWDDDGSTYAVVSSEGKLYRVDFTIDGKIVEVSQEWIEVEPEFKPVPETRTTIIRQADGRVRWLSISNTAVLNRNGEIDARALFDSFIEHAEETGEYPYRTFFHQGEALRTGMTDFMARDGYCYITSGLYDEDSKLAPYEIRALEKEPEYWGESIGFEPVEYDVMEVAEGVKIPVYLEGIHRETSTLPKDRACGLFTQTMVSREANRMRDEIKEALRKITEGDEEVVEEFAGLVDNTNLDIEQRGLITREEEEEPEVVEEQEDELEEESEAAEEEEEEESEVEAVELETVLVPFDMELDDEAVERIVDVTVQSLGPKFAERDAKNAELFATIKGLQATVTDLINLSERVDKLELSEDEKREIWLEDQPKKAQKPMVIYRPREDKKVEEGEENLSATAEHTLASMPAYK